MPNYYINHPLIPSSNIAPMKAILSELSLENIDKQFVSFKNTCFVAPQHIEKRIYNLLDNLFKTNNGQVDFRYEIDGPLINLKTHMSDPLYHFRVRKVDSNKIFAGDLSLSKNGIYENLLFAAMNSENDMWARHSSIVIDYNRLNKPGQSVLYTSLDGSTTLLEADVNIGEFFFMICYKRKQAMKFSDCCRFVAFDELTEQENLKRYVMFNLLRNEFVRVFPKTYDEQSLYCLSTNIAEHFFIHEDVDGIQYPSVRGLGANNFAFFGDSAKRCLIPVCVKFCHLSNRFAERGASVKVVANGFWKDDKFVWTPPNSELSKELLNDPVLDMFLEK